MLLIYIYDRKKKLNWFVGYYAGILILEPNFYRICYRFFLIFAETDYLSTDFPYLKFVEQKHKVSHHSHVCN
jgi:hypothetical protein